MSFSLFMGITHFAQLIIQYGRMRLYKQKDTHAKIHRKILSYILNIIYL